MADPAFDKALENTREIEITTVGRTTGRQISQPVWFVRRGDKLYLLPVGGSQSDWYKNLRQAPTIRMAAGQAEHTSPTTPITDPAGVAQPLADFGTKVLLDLLEGDFYLGQRGGRHYADIRYVGDVHHLDPAHPALQQMDGGVQRPPGGSRPVVPDDEVQIPGREGSGPEGQG